jgi:hypothetical protein|nr:MAG TPA: hypothetical protein [Caudoviricetes sp.]
MSNDQLIERTVQITIAKVSSTTQSPSALLGQTVADFMQQIYEKLSELNVSDN